VHIWGPGSTVGRLRERLSRYMSPPLFPVRLRELPCHLTLHDVPLGTFDLPATSVTAGLVCHPGTTVGYRLVDAEGTVAYVPDHEPALGCAVFPSFHHDPAHDDAALDRLYGTVGWPAVSPAREGDRYAVITAARSARGPSTFGR